MRMAGSAALIAMRIGTGPTSDKGAPRKRPVYRVRYIDLDVNGLSRGPMTGAFHLRGLIVGLAALVAQLAAAAPARAAPVAPARNATATVYIVPPSQVRKIE